MVISVLEQLYCTTHCTTPVQGPWEKDHVGSISNYSSIIKVGDKFPVLVGEIGFSGLSF